LPIIDSNVNFWFVVSVTANNEAPYELAGVLTNEFLSPSGEFFSSIVRRPGRFSEAEELILNRNSISASTIEPFITPKSNI
jgi:hypothetical protein